MTLSLRSGGDQRGRFLSVLGQNPTSSAIVAPSTAPFARRIAALNLSSLDGVRLYPNGLALQRDGCWLMARVQFTPSSCAGASVQSSRACAVLKVQARRWRCWKGGEKAVSVLLPDNGAPLPCAAEFKSRP